MPVRKIKLGDEIQDVVSKVRGIAFAYVTYLDGTNFWVIQMPVGEDDVKPREHYAPEGFCKWVGDGVYPSTKPPLGFNVGDESHARET